MGYKRIVLRNSNEYCKIESRNWLSTRMVSSL